MPFEPSRRRVGAVTEREALWEQRNREGADRHVLEKGRSDPGITATTTGAGRLCFMPLRPNTRQKKENMYLDGSKYYCNDKQILLDMFAMRNIGGGTLMVWSTLSFSRSMEHQEVEGVKRPLALSKSCREHPS